MRKIVNIVMLGLLLLLSVGSMAAQGTSVRNVRYCEVVPTYRQRLTLRTEIWNTLGLNDCPADVWEALDADALQQQLGAVAVRLNGPRYWVMDEIAAQGGVTAEGRTATFGGLETVLRAELETPLRGDLVGEQFYTPNTVQRDTRYVFNAGEYIYTLNAPTGEQYVMQSYAQIIDPTLTIDALETLGERLTLPAGWRYEAVRLNETLNVLSVGQTTIIQDNLLNTYQQANVALPNSFIVQAYDPSAFGACPDGWTRLFEVDTALYPFESNCFQHELGTLHYVDAGPKDAENVILFVHGNPNWSFMFHDAMQYMVEKGNRVVSLDQFGFGFSDSLPPEVFGYTPRQQSVILEELVVGLDLHNITLVVHDWGGPIGLGMAGRQPERIAALVINNTTGFALNQNTDSYQTRGSQWGDIASSREDQLIEDCAVVRGASTAEAQAYDPTEGALYDAVYDATLAPFVDENGDLRHPWSCGPSIWMPASIRNDAGYIPSVEANLVNLIGKPYTLIYAGGDQIFGEVHADMGNPLDPACPEPLVPVCDERIFAPGNTCRNQRTNPLNDGWVCRTAEGGSIYPYANRFKEILGEGSLVFFATTRYERHWVGSHEVTRGLIRQALNEVLQAQ
ncbi:MAG: alpha/beta fold hydrolase [Phototrophicaceae bacterium]|jgi:pimeloyl-ACP methyl ester carboxylesterase